MSSITSTLTKIEGVSVQSNPITRSTQLGRLFALVAALVLAAFTDAFAQKWQGITEAENKIVFSGNDLDDYPALHYYQPVDESNSQERYRARWTVGHRGRLVFRIDLIILPPDHHFPTNPGIQLDRITEALGRLKSFSTVDTGTVGTALGPAEFVMIEIGKHRCGAFHLFLDDGAISHPDTLGNRYLTGAYCPVSGQVDAQILESLLSKVGVRGIAVPKVEETQAGGPPGSQRATMDPLTVLVATGDIKGLRRAAAKDFDPDTIVAFQHPRFADRQVIRRPILMAAALFGQTEMVVFLLKKGATTRGRSSGAICAAVAMKHPQIVDVLLKKDPELKNYDRCGRMGSLSPIDLARRRNLHDIVDMLLETPSR